MTKSPSSIGFRFNPKIVWALVIFTVIYRIIASQVPALSNSSPTMALCFGGGLLLGRKFWWIPALLMLMSDFLIGLFNGGNGGVGLYTLLTIGVFCGAAWVGNQSSRWNGRTWPTLWCGVLVSSILFYVISNTFVWAMYPGYMKTVAGWWQCQTVGLPQYSPQSWVFLRNSLIGDSIWCMVAGVIFFIQGRFAPSVAVAA